MKTLSLQYFAVFREQAGRDTETVTSDAATLGELYEGLAGRHGFSLPAERVRVAVGESYAAMSDPLVEGVVVTYIPPVAGG